MKKPLVQQEIMLVASTTFLGRQCWEKNDSNDNQHLSPIEQLEDACWNGLLYEALPEIGVRSTSGKKLFLWHIWNGETFLQIELSEFPGKFEEAFSINTNLFLSFIDFN